MKTRLALLAPLSLILLCSQLLAAQAKLSVDQPDVLKVEGLTGPQGSDYLEASVTIDFRADMISLVLQPRMPECPEDMLCAQVMPEPIIVELNEISRSVDLCGATLYSAERDLMPVDGARESVLVIDYTTSRCQYFLPVPDTELRYERSYFNRFEGRRIDQLNILSGPQLQPAQNRVFNGKVLSASYSDKLLRLRLAFSGGCKDHAFDLEWGDCWETRLLNTSLKECKVSIVRTQGFNDRCEAWLTEDYDFDLSDLGAAYILNIQGRRVLVH